jgi:predicted  nucleic acid-binding Zn-ribbon protein
MTFVVILFFIFDIAKQAEIDFAVDSLKKQLSTTKLQLDEYKLRLDEAEETLSKIDTTGPSSTDLQKDLQDRNVEIGKLRARGKKIFTHTMDF